MHCSILYAGVSEQSEKLEKRKNEASTILGAIPLKS
jgi:hypothetical protein